MCDQPIPTGRVELESPWDVEWDTGYIISHTGAYPRRVMVLISHNPDGSIRRRSSTPYARYLMAVHLGRYLDADEEVDHIDDDPTNDAIDNLQVLSIEEHLRKTTASRMATLVEMRCSYCGTSFTRRRGVSCLVGERKNRLMCCSRQCSGRLTPIKRHYSVEKFNEELAKIFIREYSVSLAEYNDTLD